MTLLLGVTDGVRATAYTSGAWLLACLILGIVVGITGDRRPLGVSVATGLGIIGAGLIWMMPQANAMLLADWCLYSVRAAVSFQLWIAAVLLLGLMGIYSQSVWHKKRRVVRFGVAIVLCLVVLINAAVIRRYQDITLPPKVTGVSLDVSTIIRAGRVDDDVVIELGDPDGSARRRIELDRQDGVGGNASARSGDELLEEVIWRPLDAGFPVSLTHGDKRFILDRYPTASVIVRPSDAGSGDLNAGHRVVVGMRSLFLLDTYRGTSRVPFMPRAYAVSNDLLLVDYSGTLCIVDLRTAQAWGICLN